MKIEVIFYDRIGNYSPGQIAELDDGVFLRALLKGGKADVLNPPDWSPDPQPAQEVMQPTLTQVPPTVTVPASRAHDDHLHKNQEKTENNESASPTEAE